jgi:hypothetical protein
LVQRIGHRTDAHDLALCRSRACHDTVGYVADAQVRDQIEPSLIVRRLAVGWRITAVQFYD